MEDRGIKFILPLKSLKSKHKYFILNLNNYRNAHYQSLNASKVDFCYQMNARYPEKIKPITGKIRTEYTIFSKDKRLFDLPNVGSIVQKYFEDWLVSRGVIKDDNITVIPECSYYWGMVDKENPRCEAVIRLLEGEL